MEPILYQWVEPVFINNGPAAVFVPGILGWSDMAVLVLWCAMLACIGSMLALLREGAGGHYRVKVRRKVSVPRRHPVHTGPAPARLAYAQSAHTRYG